MVNKPIKKMTKTDRGFTLIELMIATSLLMMVMFSGYYAYSLYSQKWQKRVTTFWDSTNNAMAIDTITKVLLSATPYVIKGEKEKEIILFDADEQTLLFVSNSPVFSQHSALVQLELIKRNQITQLIYKEYSLDTIPLENIGELQEASFNWHHEIVLLQNIEIMSWAFYGFTSFDKAIEQNIDDELTKIENREWYSNHSADKIRLMPYRIKLQIRQEQQNSEFTLNFIANTYQYLVANFRIDA